MTKIKVLTACILSLWLIGCKSSKVPSTDVKTKKEKDGTRTTIETSQGLVYTNKEILSEDGTKLRKQPVLVLKNTGSKNTNKALAIENAKTRVANDFSRLLTTELTSSFESKIASLDGRSQEVIRESITSATESVFNSLIPGEIRVSENSGYYEAEVEMYISGAIYKQLLANAGKEAKDKIVSSEKIENTKELFEAVDEIFDGEK